MNRRAFLTLLTSAAAIAAVDPGELLTPPPIRTYFFAPPGGWQAGTWRTWEHADALRYLALDPAAQALDDAQYVMLTRRISEQEFRLQFLGKWEVERPPMNPLPQSGRAIQLMEERPAEWWYEPGGEQWTPEERAARRALRRMSDHLVNEPEVRAAIDAEMTERVMFGGLRAGKATRLREAVERLMKDRG